MTIASQSSRHPLLYLDNESDVGGFLRSIEATREIALDTEGASFHRFIDRIYLLQLSTRERSAVIDPLPIGKPAALGRLLEDPGVEVVFHDADYDLRLLHQDYGWRTRAIFDTRIAAQLLGLKSFGLSALLEQYFAVKLDKKHQRADWSMRPLTPDMLDYAAQDTRYLLELRDTLRSALEAKGRLAWAREEFALLEGTQWNPDEDADAFLRMKGARDLDRRGLAVLRELVQWRDVVARGLDRSTFRVVPNEVLLAIAAQRPRTREELGQVRGLPRGMFEHRAQEMLSAVFRGMEVAEGDLPRFPRAPRFDRDPDFDANVSKLRAVRDEVATKLELDPGVLFSRERLEAIARAKPRSMEELAALPTLRAWQLDVLGEDILRALGSAPDRSPYRD